MFYLLAFLYLKIEPPVPGNYGIEHLGTFGACLQSHPWQTAFAALGAASKQSRDRNIVIASPYMEWLPKLHFVAAARGLCFWNVLLFPADIWRASWTSLSSPAYPGAYFFKLASLWSTSLCQNSRLWTTKTCSFFSIRAGHRGNINTTLHHVPPKMSKVNLVHH